jgi:hypothetical protein
VDLPRVGDARIVDVRAIGVVTSLDANRGILVWETIIHLAGGLGRSIFAKGSLSFRGQTVRKSVFVPACVDSDSEKSRLGRSLERAAARAWPLVRPPILHEATNSPSVCTKARV